MDIRDTKQFSASASMQIHQNILAGRTLIAKADVYHFQAYLGNPSTSDY